MHSIKSKVLILHKERWLKEVGCWWGCESGARSSIGNLQCHALPGSFTPLIDNTQWTPQWTSYDFSPTKDVSLHYYFPPAKWTDHASWRSCHVSSGLKWQIQLLLASQMSTAVKMEDGLKLYISTKPHFVHQPVKTC